MGEFKLWGGGGGELHTLYTLFEYVMHAVKIYKNKPKHYLVF